MTPREALSNRERIVTVPNGWVMLPLLLAFVLGDIGLFIYAIAAGKADQPLVLPLVLSLLLLPALIVTGTTASFSTVMGLAKAPVPWSLTLCPLMVASQGPLISAAAEGTTIAATASITIAASGIRSA